MQPLPIARIDCKTGAVFQAHYRQLVAKTGKVLVQFAVRDMPGMGMGTVRPKGPCHRRIRITALHHVDQPLRAGGPGILRDEHQEPPRCHRRQQIPRATMAELCSGNGLDAHTMTACQVHGAIR